MQPDCHDLSTEKHNLRLEMRRRLKMLPGGSIQQWSEQMLIALQKRSDLWKARGTIAMFGGLRSEPDLVSSFMPWLHAQGWRTVFFAVEGIDLIPIEVTTQEDLKRGAMGVWEPSGSTQVTLNSIDIILVPGLAFGLRDGARLGRGGGFYDRLLAHPETARARRIGIAFHVQMLPDVPCEAHDIGVSEIITELDAF